MTDLYSRLLAELMKPGPYGAIPPYAGLNNARHRLASILRMIAAAERDSPQITEMESVIEGECNGLAIDRGVLQQAFEAALLSILPKEII